MQSIVSHGLYVVSTPIGNLGDFSERAQETLKHCQKILCEDTRETGKLLHHYGIKNALMSFHKFNEAKKMEPILDLLHAGAAVALVSDGGTPAISDPGTRLVRRCLQEDVRVHTVPGCCAVAAAASASGLAEQGFIFIGFLPAKSSSRIAQLKRYVRSDLALVCFESPHRILSCIDDIVQTFGVEKKLCLARELTKKFETIRLDSAAEIRDWLHQNSQQQRGEMVLVIEGYKEEHSTEQVDSMPVLQACAAAGISAKQASHATALITGVSKRECYQQYLRLVEQNANE